MGEIGRFQRLAGEMRKKKVEKAEAKNFLIRGRKMGGIGLFQRSWNTSSAMKEKHWII